jgi:CheY-like chemotaxis protein
MQTSGGTLTIEAENQFLDEQFAGMLPNAKAGQYVVITITDTGTGIAPEALEKIFDPFFTTKEVGRGTGLGLSTVHSIIKSHGGFVNVYSEVGKGTKFSLYLPALETGQPLQPAAQPTDLPLGRGELILVVDDERAIREITQGTLESFGYRVLTAADGTEAIVLYAQHKDEIRLVLTDMMMPYLDGPATIRALRKINPALEVIASSGLHETERIHEATELGVKYFLTKPYTAQELLQMLHRTLGAQA